MTSYQTKVHAGCIHFGQMQQKGLLHPVILIGIAALFLLAVPVSAGTQYLSGSPDLSVSLSGTNEFTAGKQVTLPVVIQNSGVNDFKIVKTETVNRDDLPNTAKFLTVTLEPGTSPFIIKSDPQMVGDVKASSTATATFAVRIPSGTPAGTYNLPVKLNYTYLYSAEQYGVDTIQYIYKSKDEVYTIPVKVKPDVQIDVVSSKIGQMNAGTEGSIQLELKNTGLENAKKAIIIIARNDGSPVIPSESSAYIGDFPAGGTATGVFKAKVDSSAEAQTYPLDVYVKYENREGDTISSDTETIGIPVGRKVEFTIVSEPETITPGQKKVITIQYKNTGGAVARQAQARISMVDPFTSNDDSAYLGDIAPGETKSASFLVTADKAATLKQYGIDSEIRYRDAFDNQIISDPIKVSLNVGEDKGVVAGILKNPVALVVIALIVIGIGFALYRKRQNQ